MAVEPRLVLASASPRRLDLLRLAGLDAVVRPADIDERRLAAEEPAAYVERLAAEKSAAVAVAAGEVVVAADTAVILDGDVLGKPADRDDAVTMLRRLQGRAHLVSTGVAVVAGGTTGSTVVTTEVVLAPLADPTIHAYVATGEPLDKAGAYGIQGRAAAFVTRIDGSWTNVVGLPLVETLDLLRQAGVTAT